MITSSTLYGAVRVQHDNKTGSAYTFEKEVRQYLV
jgi:hypothetical protein